MILAVLGLASLLSLATKDVVPVVSASVSGVALSSSSAVSASPANRNVDVEAMLRALNAERTSRGLQQLALDPNLCTIAQAHAVDMVERKYFAHVSPEGATPFDRMTRAHYSFGYAGENLALDQSAAAAELALLHSLEHRKNMLEPHYAKVGIAAIPSTDGEIFVEDFSD